MAMRANIWVGRWPARAKKLAETLGEEGAAVQLTIEMKRPISRNGVRGCLTKNYPGWKASSRTGDGPKSAVDPVSILRDKASDLEQENDHLRKNALSEERIQREIFRLASRKLELPDWVVQVPKRGVSVTGIPAVNNSDEHWGEVVDPAQIGGVNFYDLDEARNRLRRFTENTLDLLFNHTTNPKYPGLVVCYAGDGVTGDIHEELSATNDCETMPALHDLVRHRIKSLTAFLDNFPKVLVVGVTGNHGRNTKKIRAKGRAYTNFDWLGYQMLQMYFEANSKYEKRIQFRIPSGPDAHFPIYNHRYLLTHGDRLGHGGDGIIGAIGPIIRGTLKKGARNAQIGQVFQTLICGHWHQYMPLPKVIVNGSLKGYDEYANQESFGFEPPQQAMWITHPERGITFQAPVFVTPKQPTIVTPWTDWDSKR